MAEGVTLLGKGRFIRLLRKPDGWEYAERVGTTGAVVIAGVTTDEKIILVEQFRPPLNANVLELPAGLAGDEEEHGADESMKKAARREFFEETGYEADELIFVLEGPCSPGLSNETFTLFWANGLNKTGAGGGVGQENITTHEISVAVVESWLNEQISRGLVVDPKVFLALYFYNKNLKRT
ncbi:MAG: NUDIX hydrolase [Nitrospinota bacterium]